MNFCIMLLRQGLSQELGWQPTLSNPTALGLHTYMVMHECWGWAYVLMLVEQAHKLLSHYYSPGIIKFKDCFVEPGDAHGSCFFLMTKNYCEEIGDSKGKSEFCSHFCLLWVMFSQSFFCVCMCVYLCLCAQCVQVPMFLCMYDAETINQCWVASPTTCLLTFWGKYFNEITDLTHWVVSEHWGSSSLCLLSAGITGAHFSINA